MTKRRRNSNSGQDPAKDPPEQDPEQESESTSVENPKKKKKISSDRTHEENQERAYVAASRRSDRSTEARMQSARMASEIHFRRTGKYYKITEEAVLKEEMFEEIESAQTRMFRLRNVSQLDGRAQMYVGYHTDLAQAMRHREVEREFDQAFPNLLSDSQQQAAGPLYNQGLSLYTQPPLAQTLQNFSPQQHFLQPHGLSYARDRTQSISTPTPPAHQQQPLQSPPQFHIGQSLASPSPPLPLRLAPHRTRSYPRTTPPVTQRPHNTFSTDSPQQAWSSDSGNYTFRNRSAQLSFSSDRESSVFTPGSDAVEDSFSYSTPLSSTASDNQQQQVQHDLSQHVQHDLSGLSLQPSLEMPDLSATQYAFTSEVPRNVRDMISDDLFDSLLNGGFGLGEVMGSAMHTPYPYFEQYGVAQPFRNTYTVSQSSDQRDNPLPSSESLDPLSEQPEQVPESPDQIKIEQAGDSNGSVVLPLNNEAEPVGTLDNDQYDVSNWIQEEALGSDSGT